MNQKNGKTVSTGLSGACAAAALPAAVEDLAKHGERPRHKA